MDLQFIDLLQLSRTSLEQSLTTGLGRYFMLAKKIYPSIKLPTTSYAATDQALKIVFEKRNSGWPIVVFSSASMVRSFERGSPVNMYRQGQIGKLLDNSLSNYTTLKLIPQDITHDVAFLTNKVEEQTVFCNAWSILANTSGLKFDLELPEIGLKIPIGASLDENLSMTSNEDPEIPYLKVQTTLVLKTFSGMAQTVPAIHGTLQDYTAAMSKPGPALPLDPSAISFKNPSNL